MTTVHKLDIGPWGRPRDSRLETAEKQSQAKAAVILKAQKLEVGKWGLRRDSRQEAFEERLKTFVPVGHREFKTLVYGRGATDLIIGMAGGYGWPQLEPFVTSLRQCGYKGRCVLIFNEGPQDESLQVNLQRLSIESYFTKFAEHPIVARFRIIPDILKAVDYSLRYVLSIDTRDVIFQSDPTVWLEKNIGSAGLVAVSEGQRYKDSPPNRQNIEDAFGQATYDQLAEEEVLNCGTIAGVPEEVARLSFDIYDICSKDQRPKIFRPGVITYADQAAQNMLIRTEKYQAITKIVRAKDGFVSTWCQLHRTLLQDGTWELEHHQQEEIANGRPNLPEEEYSEFRNGVIYPGGSATPFTMFHQYDVTQPWREAVQARRRKSVKVSIVIPVYNTQETLAETIESALAQTYENFDVVVVDDGSTDDSGTLVDSFASRYAEKIRVFHTSNQGVAEARNFGALQTDSEALLFIDSDDKITNDYLAKTVPLLAEGVGVVSTDMQYFGKRQDRTTARVSTIWANEMPIASLIRKVAFVSASGYDNTVAYEDWDLWMKTIKLGWGVATLNEPLFLYRIDKNLRCADADKEITTNREQIRNRHAKTALLLIATGSKYQQYIEKMLTSAQRYFVPHTSILWTDVPFKTLADIQIPHLDLGFPTVTLRRYRTFLSQEQLLREFDYLFYVDIDALFVDKIYPDEIFADGLTATAHPGFVGEPGSPETNPESTAFLAKPRIYFAGGFNGGRAGAFLQMAKTIDHNIDIDERKGIRALWNDESHLNRYLYDNPPARVLTPAFCYPDKNHDQGYYRRRWLAAGIGDFQPKIELINKGTPYVPKETKMVVHLFGGLGNQLFQYAFGVSVGAERREEVLFTPQGTLNNPARQIRAYGLDAFADDIKLCENAPDTTTYYEQGHAFNPQVYVVPPGSSFYGWWQTEKYFNESLVRQKVTFRYPLSAKSNEVAEAILQAGKASAFLSIRRNDFLTNTTDAGAGHGCIGMGYYNEAIRRIREQYEDVQFFVFGDDPEWARANFSQEGFTIVDHVQHDTPQIHEDMHLMSLCRHGAIAHGTFSWWSAWLGDHQKDRLIFTPDRWFKDLSVDMKDMTPDRWIKLPGWQENA